MRYSQKKDPLPPFSEKAITVKEMFDRIAPRYDMLNRLMTFGLDMRWRKKTVRSIKTSSYGTVLDIACGTGDLCESLRKSKANPIGLDFSRGMFNSFNSKAPLIRNFHDIHPFLKETARILKPGARLALLEVDEPKNTFIKAGHSFYFNKVVPFIGGLFSDKAAYRYLPHSVIYLPKENELIEMIQSSGFKNVKKFRLTGGIAQLLIAEKVEN